MKRKTPKAVCFFVLLAAAGGVFAAIPIQGAFYRGAGAAEARLRVLAAAESCLGVPYRYAGADRGGLDCSGLVYLSFREGLNIEAPRSSGGLYAWAEKIPGGELAPGDLVFFDTGGAGVSHLGIYAGEGRFIHSASEGPRTGVIYSRLDEAYWKRRYIGAGRALPWNAEAARAMASARAGGESFAPLQGASGENASPGRSGGNGAPGFGALPPVWNEPGFFAGFGAAWTWGGFFQGAPSLFRGLSTLATAGYKGEKFRAGLELRPEWDRALGVFRLPVALAVGTDLFQVFAGPAYSFGDAGLDIDGRERRYRDIGWSWEAGLSGAFPPLRIGRGGLSIYGELAWQPYLWEDGAFSLKPDLTANMRVSTGIRYLWRLGKSASPRAYQTFD